LLVLDLLQRQAALLQKQLQQTLANFTPSCDAIQTKSDRGQAVGRWDINKEEGKSKDILVNTRKDTTVPKHGSIGVTL
jgi:hypothetical protein